MFQLKKVELRDFRCYSEVSPIAFALWGTPSPQGQGEEQTSGQGESADLPKEVGTAEAAELLGVSKDTVLKLKAAGLLEYRNTAPPSSSRPVYAFTLRSVMELRTSYERDEPVPASPKESRRRQVKGPRTYKHLELSD